MFKVFIISVGIAFSIEIIHSALTKGWKFTLEFFGGGFLFGFLRELILFSFVRIYDFPNMPIKLLNVPILIPIGWVFTFYLAYEFINKLIYPKTEKDYKDFVILASFFSTFICIPIETVAMNMNWWVLFISINDNIASVKLMGGWLGTSVMFFNFYFFIKKKISREQLWLAFILVIHFLTSTYLYYFFVFPIILLMMFKLNKEIAFIFVIYTIIGSCGDKTLFLSIPNGIFVTISFIFNFIYILAKFYLRNSVNQLNTKTYP